MKSVIHHGYVITVTANNEKGVWRGHEIINWDEGKFDIYDEVCFTIEIDAEGHAVELGKHWVNNLLQRMQVLLKEFTAPRSQAPALGAVAGPLLTD